MGSSFLTIDEAALRLGRHKRSIHNYLEKGFLRRVRREGKVLIPFEDVEQLAVELGTDHPAINRHTIFDLSSRMKKLEEQMAMVQGIWGIQEKPLRPSPQEVAGLLKAAADYLSAPMFEMRELETWADLLNKIDEKTLTAIAEHGLTTKPWELFFELAGRMVEVMEKDKTFTSSLGLQALHGKMESGRRKVREAALFWIESGRGTVPSKVFKLFDTPKEDLLRRLSQSGRKS